MTVVDDDLTPEEEAELERLEALHAKRLRGRQEPPAPDDTKLAEAKAAEATAKGCLGCGGLILLLVVIGSLAAFFGSDDEEGSEDPRVLQLTAFDVCKDFVSQRLKSPGSAKFRNFFEEDGEVIVSGVADGPYKVISTVDSQNGFGALIRSRFSCTVTLDRAADSWRLNDLDLVDGGG